jgi:cytochrome c biogenesis protein ResB
VAQASTTGWEAAAPLAEETIDPKRNTPRATLLSICILGVFLVITKGDPLQAFSGGTFLGDLLIFFGAIVDGIWGWRGTLQLNEGETTATVDLRDGTTRALPFAIRCDEAGQENYKDGTPKKWWSKLAVVKSGQDVVNKEIVVNDPLLYGGVRFYQSSFGPNGKVEKLVLEASPTAGSGEKRQIAFALNETASLDAGTTVRFAEFIPDYAVRDGQVYKKSNQLGSPAAHLVTMNLATR